MFCMEGVNGLKYPGINPKNLPEIYGGEVVMMVVGFAACNAFCMCAQTPKNEMTVQLRTTRYQ